jgi:hypothetical protein
MTSIRKSYLQGDLCITELTTIEAAKLSGSIAKSPQRGSIRLLEGDVTGHHHEIVMGHPDDEANAEAITAAAIAFAKAKAAASRGTATLYADMPLARSLKWLLRTDLMIGFLKVEGGPVNLRHPEHDMIKLPTGTYYVGRQVESAGAEERQVKD